MTVIKFRRPPRRPAFRRAPRPHGGVFRFGLALGALAGLILVWAEADTGRIQRLPDAAISGTPTKVVDGDTFDIGGHRIRLDGVDAPEMSTPFGAPAIHHLAALLAAGPSPARTPAPAPTTASSPTASPPPAATSTPPWSKTAGPSR